MTHTTDYTLRVFSTCHDGIVSNILLADATRINMIETIRHINLKYVFTRLVSGLDIINMYF